MRTYTMCIAAILTCFCLHARAADLGSEQKVIAWGRGDTDTRYMREHIEIMEQAPLDGVIFEVFATTAKGRENFSGHFWGARRFTADELEPAIDDLRSTHFTRFTDNFLRLNVTPGDVDWFDPEFDAVLENARMAARVAAAADVRGIALDPEMYTQPVFVYGGQEYRATKSYEDYCRQVRLRGRQFMEALQAEWESPLLFLTYAWTQVAMDPAPRTQMKGYGLLPSFLDGWLDAAGPNTVIIDGFEQSYTYRDDEQFARARTIFDKTAETTSTAPEAYRKHVRLGFGLWLDQGVGSFPWRVDEPEQNKMSPLEFEYALHRALAHSDRYVWIFAATPNWWTGENLPPAYAEAVRNARRHHDPAWKTERAIPGGRDVTFLAAGCGGDDGKATFGALWEKYEPVMDLPKEGWLFRPDSGREGEAQHWYAPDTDTAAWNPIEIGKFWGEQGYTDLHGVAWYRRAIDVPASAEGKRLLLSFGAVDETAVVYVNGREAGGFGLLGYTWTDRFEVDVTPHLKPGEANLIAIRVEDTTGVAGIWKPVKLITPRG